MSRCRYRRSNLLEGGKHAHEGKRSSFQYQLVIDTHLERPVGSVLECDFGTEVTSQHGCRPGSLNRGDSINAPSNFYLHWVESS